MSRVKNRNISTDNVKTDVYQVRLFFVGMLKMEGKKNENEDDI